METLWAPWRMEYIKTEKPDGCIFCDVQSRKNDTENLIVARRDHCFVIMNSYPYNNGHLLVVPYHHVGTLNELNADEQCEMMTLLNDSIEILQKELNPQGFNTGMNLGKAAGAGIDDHIHMHIVPRWTNPGIYCAERFYFQTEQFCCASRYPVHKG